MRQVIQNLRTGEIKMEEVPAPSIQEGFVLVKVFASLISSGTERATIDMAKSSLLNKAKKRPDLVKQVLRNIKKEGIFATLQKVNNKLGAPKALGYSSSGVVIESKDFYGKYKTGDRVACAGQDYAAHADIVSIPQNLIAKISDNVSFEEASFTTVGSVAMQGVRQAQPQIGEKICVIGLGLIGQITFQILQANGCHAFGIDISNFKIELAKKLGIDFAVTRTDKDLYNLVDAFTNGYGFDKVIITAYATDNDPIVLATEVLRKKGLIVIVGDIKIDIPREPHFYKKELELKISTSYGPGRYDPLYEEAGIDYPYAYVRFTENRNMQAFLELLSKGTVKVKPLITNVFDFADALKAYDIILNKKEDCIGILFTYKELKKEEVISKISVNTRVPKVINVGFIGAGSFAQNYLLPNLNKSAVSLDTVVTTKGYNAKNIARKFGFNCASTNSLDIINNKDINTVFIATRHDSHAEYVCSALQNKKNVFVEKPLALNYEELRKIIAVYKGESILMVGFNRRFAPISQFMKAEVNKFNMPSVMNFRINAEYIPNEHWIQDYDIGGGRIIGEVCHFLDLMLYFSDSLPKTVFASSINIDSDKWRGEDNISVTIEFENGSIGNLVYTSMGDVAMEKERLEYFAGGVSFVINNFKEGLLYKESKINRIKNNSKGYKEEIDKFIHAIKGGDGNPISFESLVYTTMTTLKIRDSLKNKRAEKIDISELY